MEDNESKPRQSSIEVRAAVGSVATQTPIEKVLSEDEGDSNRDLPEHSVAICTRHRRLLRAVWASPACRLSCSHADVGSSPSESSEAGLERPRRRRSSRSWMQASGGNVIVTL